MVDKEKNQKTSTLSVNSSLKKISLKESLENIQEKIEKDGKYEEDNIEVVKSEIANTSISMPLELSSAIHFFGVISKEKSSYSGILNENLERNLFGIEKFSNGDLYCGHFIKDIKCGRGIYLLNPETSKKTVKYELYSGDFNGNLMSGLGTYTVIEEAAKNSTIDEANISSYIGSFENNKMKRGIYLEKKQDKFCAYYGNFNQDNQKHDSKALLYDNENDQVLRARFENGEIIKGFLLTFKDDEKKEVFYISYEKGKVKAVTTENFIEKQTVEKIVKEGKEFRNILFAQECFEKAYDNAKKITTEKQKLESITLKDFNTEKGFADVQEVFNMNTEQGAFKEMYKNLGC